MTQTPYKLVLIPTTQGNQLYISSLKKMLISDMTQNEYNNQILCIIDDSEIKLHDWITDGEFITQVKTPSDLEDGKLKENGWNKIIASSDARQYNYNWIDLSQCGWIIDHFNQHGVLPDSVELVMWSDINTPDIMEIKTTPSGAVIIVESKPVLHISEGDHKRNPPLKFTQQTKECERCVHWNCMCPIEYDGTFSYINKQPSAESWDDIFDKADRYGKDISYKEYFNKNYHPPIAKSSNERMWNREEVIELLDNYSRDKFNNSSFNTYDWIKTHLK